jgi:hypothetical protein
MEVKIYSAAIALTIALALSACASPPEFRPVVSDRQLSPKEIFPGESVKVAFKLQVKDPATVRSVQIRGLPENTLSAGTRTGLSPPSERSTAYDADIEILPPAADGNYNLDLVFKTNSKTYVAPLGTLAIRDTPSRILYTQFTPSNHTASRCLSGTKLLSLEYTVVDDNGAADFVAPTLVAANEESKKFVFFPHWEPINWLGDKPGIMLERPTAEAAREELVRSDIRIHCKMPQASLYQYVIRGQSVSRLTGKSTPAGSDPARYYVE